MRCIGRVLNPSRPVGPTTCKAIPGLALSLDSWNRSSVRPSARPVGTAYLQGRPSEASGTSSESLTTRKREGCKPAADEPAREERGTLDSNRLARFSPFVAEVALELTTLKKTFLELRTCALHRSCPESFPSSWGQLLASPSRGWLSA